MELPIMVAYNIKERKIGCALVQAGMGATISGGDVTFHFHTDYWEMNPSKCELYEIKSQAEFDFMTRVTKDWHENKRTTS